MCWTFRKEKIVLTFKRQRTVISPVNDQFYVNIDLGLSYVCLNFPESSFSDGIPEVCQFKRIVFFIECNENFSYICIMYKLFPFQPVGKSWFRFCKAYQKIALLFISEVR